MLNIQGGKHGYDIDLFLGISLFNPPARNLHDVSVSARLIITGWGSHLTCTRNNCCGNDEIVLQGENGRGLQAQVPSIWQEKHLSDVVHAPKLEASVPSWVLFSSEFEPLILNYLPWPL